MGTVSTPTIDMNSENEPLSEAKSHSTTRKIRTTGDRLTAVRMIGRESSDLMPDLLRDQGLSVSERAGNHSATERFMLHAIWIDTMPIESTTKIVPAMSIAGP